VKWWRSRCYQTFAAGLPSAAIRLCPGRHVRKLWFSSRRNPLCSVLARALLLQESYSWPGLFTANYSDQIPLIR
jgi:hypothetical protein